MNMLSDAAGCRLRWQSVMLAGRHRKLNYIVNLVFTSYDVSPSCSYIFSTWQVLRAASHAIGWVNLNLRSVLAEWSALLRTLTRILQEQDAPATCQFMISQSI